MLFYLCICYENDFLQKKKMRKRSLQKHVDVVLDDVTLGANRRAKMERDNNLEKI